MLAISIKLNSAVVPMPISIFNTRLERTRKAKIAGQVQKRISIVSANLDSPINGTVVNDKVVNIGNSCGQPSDRRLERLLFVISRNNNQCLQNGLS